MHPPSWDTISIGWHPTRISDSTFAYAHQFQSRFYGGFSLELPGLCVCFVFFLWNSVVAYWWIIMTLPVRDFTSVCPYFLRILGYIELLSTLWVLAFHSHRDDVLCRKCDFVVYWFIILGVKYMKVSFEIYLVPRLKYVFEEGHKYCCFLVCNGFHLPFYDINFLLLMILSLSTTPIQNFHYI